MATLAVAATFALFVGCPVDGGNGNGGGSTDTAPPPEVSNLTATTGNGAVTLAWENPTVADFAKVRISWTSDTSDDAAEVLKDDSPNNSYIISGLSNGAAYTVTVHTVDSNNNISLGHMESVQLPTFGFNDALYLFELSENVSGAGDDSVPIGAIATFNADALTPILFSHAGADATLFTINENSGNIAYVGGGENYEVMPQRAINVVISDGATQYTAPVMINITDGIGDAADSLMFTLDPPSPFYGITNTQQITALIFSHEDKPGVTFSVGNSTRSCSATGGASFVAINVFTNNTITFADTGLGSWDSGDSYTCTGTIFVQPSDGTANVAEPFAVAIYYDAFGG